jgi:surfeit locus 1 family protein
VVIDTRRLRRWIVPALGTALAVPLFIQLGLWQRGKAERVQAALAEFEARAHLPPVQMGAGRLDPIQANNARFMVRGRFESSLQFFIDNRQEGGRAGVHVITPLRIDQSDMRVLINRGWVAWPGGRGVLPRVSVPEGTVEISGTAQVPSIRKPLWVPERQEAARDLWERLDLARFSTMSGHAVQPVVLLQDDGDSNDGLVRHWPPPENRAPMHTSYAYQWFGIAAVLVAFFGYSAWRDFARARASAAPGI